MVEAAGRRAVIYCRISQDRAGAGLGVDRQETECRGLAARLDLNVVKVHADNDLSAYSGKARPGYECLLGDIRGGRADVVLAWHTDRLHRSPVELEAYIEACQPRGVATHTVQAGHLDLSTASGRMVARQLGAVARYESEHKGDRVRAARRQAALAGRWSGGRRPFGFEADGVTIRPAEAAEIVAATDVILAGGGLRTVARSLNARGVTTTFAVKAWTPLTVKDLLVRPRNAGLAVYHGEIVGEAVWPAIVPVEKWRAVVAILGDPRRRTMRSSRVRWLGSGLYVCGVCGQVKLRVSTSGKREPAYRCASRDYVPEGTGHVVRKAAPLDDWVGRNIAARLRRPDAADLLVPSSPEGVDTDTLHAEAVTLRQRLDDLAEAHADGEVTLSQLTRGSERMRRRLDGIEAELAQAGRMDPLVGLVGVDDPWETWRALDIDTKRAVLAELATVTVHRTSLKRGPDGSRFNPDSIEIEWKR
jgi:site-specific DNA recombinase